MQTASKTSSTKDTMVVSILQVGVTNCRTQKTLLAW